MRVSMTGSIGFLPGLLGGSEPRPFSGVARDCRAFVSCRARTGGVMDAMWCETGRLNTLQSGSFWKNALKPGLFVVRFFTGRGEVFRLYFTPRARRIPRSFARGARVSR